MKSENLNNPWKLQYDEVLEQYHYINVIDNTITFDLPCEVHYTPELIRPRSIFHKKKRASSSWMLGLEMCKQTSWGSSDSSLLETSKKKTLLAKLGSVLRYRHRSEVAEADVIAARDTDEQSGIAEESDDEMSDVNNYNYDRTMGASTDSFRDVNSMISGLDDAYLLDKSTNSKNFAELQSSTMRTTNRSVRTVQAIQFILITLICHMNMRKLTGLSLITTRKGKGMN